MRTKASFPPQIVGFYVSGRRAAHPPADEADIFVLVLVSVSELTIWRLLKSSQPPPLGHSARSAATGFTDAARCAGI
jgi:hypothetical protein